MKLRILTTGTVAAFVLGMGILSVQQTEPEQVSAQISIEETEETDPHTLTDATRGSHRRPEFENIEVTTERQRFEEIQSDKLPQQRIKEVKAVEVVIPEEPQPKRHYYATMELTAYEWTGSPCADGVYPETNHTAACNDPNLWHKWILIEGVGIHYVHDTGGMSSNVIDIYKGDVSSCLAFGHQTGEVYIIDE